MRPAIPFLAASLCGLLLITGVFAAAALAQAESRKQDVLPAIDVFVDPSLDLVSIVFRLAGSQPYAQASTDSPYVRAADAHFLPFAGHAAVAAARRLRGERGIGYDAVASLAVHLDAPPECRERAPLDGPSSRLDSRWRPEEAREFLALLREFATATGYVEFAAEHTVLWTAASSRLRARLERSLDLPWFLRYFGERPGANSRVRIGLVCGRHNFSVGVRQASDREEISLVIGAWRFDREGLPDFGEELIGVAAHELAHAWINPWVDAAADVLEEPGRRLFATCQEVMSRQAYGHWKTVVAESLVRAAVCRYLAVHGGPEAVRLQIADDERRGFQWIAPLVERLAVFEKEGGSPPALPEFIRALGPFLASVAERAESRARQAPRVVRTAPPNGALEVDPATSELVVVFDQAMRKDSCSVCGDDSAKIVNGKQRFDAAGTTFFLPIRLEPGTSYELWLNSPARSGFQSAAGEPLAPFRLSFRTRGP